jgi:hypothetical protein
MVAFRIIGIEAPKGPHKNASTSRPSTISEVPAAPASQTTPRSVRVRDDVSSVREGFRGVLFSESSSNTTTSNDTPSAAVEARTGATSDVVGGSGPANSAAQPEQNEPAQTAAGLAGQPRLWLPAAMLEPDESIGISSELQVAEWEQLQEDFVQAVNGRAPGSEDEREAWIHAQEENDDLFRQKFGWEAFQAQQLKAYREGLAPEAP